MEGKKEIKISLGTAIILILAILLIIVGVVFAIWFKNKEQNKTEALKANNTETKQDLKYSLKGNSLEDFDLRFLQLENEKVNKIYSPLSIKYTLGMLNEGTEGTAKEQISSIIGEYQINKYVDSENMSFANALFVRDTYKESIKEDFVDNLRNKYNADVIYDSFSTAKNVNSWVSDKTFDLINDILTDQDVNDLDFMIINALAIDMDWKNKFLDVINISTSYQHENYGWTAPIQLLSNEFEGVQNEISGMGIIASINNYDIVNTLGEENIRKTVGEEFRKYLNENPSSFYLEGKDIETAVEDYLDEYIEALNANYRSKTMNTDFLMYEDENVKAFAKDLKEYDGTTLQYVAIMPEEDLDKYIDNITATDINEVIDGLKEIESENFKEGVITEIVGFIPKFKFDYQLDLINDLQELGITEVFDSDKNALTGITKDEAYISKTIHKANIEFTQDGIKAAATTVLGGYGAGGEFDYIYDVPVERIVLNFNKPYMFIIRDKETGEVWFTGTVYNPLSLEDEKEADNYMESYSDFIDGLEATNDYSID